MTPLRVAIVGAGLMGRWHAYYVPRAGGRVCAIVDRDHQAAQHLQRRTSSQASLFADLSECLQACSVDVVHVCTSSASHASLADRAMQAGKHVLVEKPAAPGRDEAVQLVQRAHGRSVLLCPVHQFPFQDGCRRLPSQLSSLGSLVRMNYSIHSSGGEGLPPDRRREVLLEMLPHAVSLMRLLDLGGPNDWQWSISRFTTDDLDLVGRRQDLLLEINFSLRGRPPRNELRVVGTKTTATADLFHGFVVRQSGGTSRLAKIARPLGFSLLLCTAASCNLIRRAIGRQPAYPGLSRLIGEFYRAVQTGVPPPVDPEEMVDAATLMDLVRGQPEYNPETAAAGVGASPRST